MNDGQTDKGGHRAARAAKNTSDQIDQISPLSFCKTCFSTSERFWHAKNYLVKSQKFWDLRDPPPRMGKTPKKSRIFSERLPY